MRQAVVKLDKTLKEYKFLCENHIDSPQELVSFITEKREQIAHWKTMSSIKTKKEVMHNEKQRNTKKEGMNDDKHNQPAEEKGGCCGSGQ